MVQQSTLTFLQKLSKNNNKEWFDAHRKDYEAAKENMLMIAEAILKELSHLEPAFENQKAKDCVFRIYRDVRFSKDKKPYKNNMGAYFNKGGKKALGGGFYMHIQPSKSFVGGGIWMPEAPVLKSIRQEIDYNFKEFKGIVDNKNFKKVFKKLEGEQLKNPPKGYDAENLAIEYLKMKSFVAMTPFTDKDITSKAFVKKCVEVFKTMNPLIEFLNRATD